MSVRIDLLLSVLTSHPEQVDTVAPDIQKTLEEMPRRSQFFDAVESMFEKAYKAEPELMPVFAKLFKTLRETSIVSSDTGKICSMNHALSSCFAQPLGYTAKGLSLFRQKLPFMNAIFRINLVTWKILKDVIAHLPTKLDEISLRYLCAIVQNASDLVDDGVMDCSGPEEQFWQYQVKRLRRAYDSDTEFECSSTVDEMSALFKYLKKKKRWYPDVVSKRRSNHSQSSERLSSKSNLKRTRHYSTDSHSQRSGWTEPNVSWLNRLAPIEIARRKSYKPFRPWEVADHPRPQPLPPQPLPQPQQVTPAAVNHQQSPIGKVMATLSNYPHYLATATADIKTLLGSVTSLSSLADGVFEILNAAFQTKSTESFTSCIKLIEKFRNFVVKINNDQLSFRDAVCKCTVIRSNFTNHDQIERFCASFRLINELFRLGLVPRDIFQFYIDKMTNDATSSLANCLLFRVIRNVYVDLFDSNLKSNVVDFNEKEISYWENCTKRLEDGLDDLEETDAADAVSLLEFIKTKGGWRRPKPVDPEPSLIPKVEAVSEPDDLSPSLEHSDATQAFSESSTVSTILPVDAVDLENNSNWVEMLKDQLVSTRTLYDFAKLLSSVVKKMLVKIDDEKTSDEAAEILQYLGQIDFGRGRNFKAELQNFVTKYLCGKNQSDFNKLQEALQAESDCDEAALSQKLAMFQCLFEKRRLGCVRLTCRLFQRQYFDVDFLVSFIDSLFAAGTEECFQCLLQLFTNIGLELSKLILQHRIDVKVWWMKLFEEIAQIEQTSPKLTAILSEKSKWEDFDPKKLALEKLEMLLSSNDLAGVRALLANESSGQPHIEQVFDVFIRKMEQIFAIVPGSTPSPRPRDLENERISATKRSHAPEMVLSDETESPPEKKILTSDE